MKAYELNAPVGLDSLAIVERDIPNPGAGEVLVRLHAASLNYRDIQVASGQYGNSGPERLSPLSDGAGEVVAVGDGVSRFKVGDRVAGIFMQTWLAGPMRNEYPESALGGAIDGVLTEYRTFSEDGLTAIPDYLTYEEAATLPCAAVTVWNGLFVQGQAQPGDTIVLQGTGGVSLFGLQFAKAAGMRTILTSSSDEKLAKGRALGADVTINYKSTPQWARPVKEATGGVGADHVIEVGGPGTLDQSLHAVRMGGRISMIGVLTGVKGEVSTANLLRKSIHVNGIYVGSREMFEAMNRMLTANEIHPVVDRVFAFEEARAAYDHMKSGAHFGKIVIRIAA